MPFASQAQAGFMFANHPAIAKEFALHTNFKKLGEKKKPKGKATPKSLKEILHAMKAPPHEGAYA